LYISCPDPAVLDEDDVVDNLSCMVFDPADLEDEGTELEGNTRELPVEPVPQIPIIAERVVVALPVRGRRTRTPKAPPCHICKKVCIEFKRVVPRPV
jgi:hypothetical protein